MKELILLRHAKSSWDDPSLGDFERPLAPRGRRAAPMMGRQIATRGWVPDHVLVSSARRAQQTWRLVAAELDVEAGQAVFDEGLYMAPADRLLAAIRKSPPSAARLLMVGHNPGLEALAIGLAGPGSDDGALEQMSKKFPSGALARFMLDSSWQSLSFGAAKLMHFLRPKDFS